MIRIWFLSPKRQTNMLSVLKCQIHFGDLAALLSFQLTSIFTSCHLTKNYVKDKLVTC